MNARYCNNCGKINPAENHPLGGCTCPRPDFTVRPTAYEQIRSLEDQLATLQAAVDLLLVARRPVAPSSPHMYLPDNPEARLFLDRLAALREDSERLGKLGGGDRG